MSSAGVNHQTQAVLLLTAHFGKPQKSDPKPLTPTEWGRFAQWLREHHMQPETLLLQDPATVLADWDDRTITFDRVQYLLNRSGTLGLALEKWERAGLWVLPRSDPQYPARLKRLLKNESPAVLFGCGNRSLLNGGGIAVIGSRDVSEDDLAFTTRLGGEAALQGFSIVSGGARGADEAAMLGALECDGTVIGVLADSLLRSATSAKYRKGLMANNLVLVSPFNPEAGFDVGNAMSRNKYIYCLADAAVVIATSKNKGGTWNGALENLKAGWVPLWVKSHHNTNSGNAALVQEGAHWLPDSAVQFADLLVSELAQHADAQPNPSDEEAVPVGEEAAPPVAPDQAETVAEQPSVAVVQSVFISISDDLSFYDLFIRRLEQLAADEPKTAKQISAALDVNKTQIDVWLKRAVADGYVIKKKRGSYQWVPLQLQEPTTLANEHDAAQVGASNA